MAKPFSALPFILSRREREYLRGVDKIVRGAAVAGGRRMAEATKVDTGLARSNYQASIGVPNDGVVPPYAPGAKLGRGEQGNLIGVTNQQANTASAWTPTRGAPFFIANNIPYIGILNFGGRNHAPGNMLRMGLQAAITYIKTPRRILR